MAYPAALGQRPLDVREAYDALAQYARDYGRAPLLLLMHACVPETLRPDLLNLIRVNFLAAHGADPSLEADVLFAPVTTALGGGYYRIDPQVRWHGLALLRSLYRHDARPRPRRIAELLWRYVEARQHQASRAADPQLAEFLDIQRWVALAFLDPAGAARAFADALHQAGDAPGSVALRLGGLASAIELPLSGQPELIAYARGLDALAGGNDADAERLLGALGDGELRIGDVVLKAATAVLAEGKRQTAAMGAGNDATPKRRCLVIIGRGVKVDPTTGRGLDLEVSYLMIRDAVTAFGLTCWRRDDLPGGGLDMKAVFQEILDTDLVICDLSSGDPEVAYLYGIALALRKSGVLPVVDKDVWQALGGLFKSESTIRYRHDSHRIDPSEVKLFTEKIKRILEASDLLPHDNFTQSNSPLTLHSGVYLTDPPLTPPHFEEIVRKDTELDTLESDLCILIEGDHFQTDQFSKRNLNLAAVTYTVREALGSIKIHGISPNSAFNQGLPNDSYTLDCLRRAPYAVVDLSTLPVNTLIILGVRHGLRPHHTLLIAEDQLRLPPEFASLHILRFKHLGDGLEVGEARRLQAAIVDWLKAAMAATTVDSPVYAALPTLRPPQRITVVDPATPDAGPQQAEPASAEAPPEAEAAAGPATGAAAPPPPPRVFLSYFHGYRHYASPLAKALRALGVAVQWDMDLRTGDNWAEDLARMLEEADAVVAVTGRQTGGSAFAMDEIHRTVRLGKPLFPVIVDEGAPSEVLSYMAANVEASGHIAYLARLKELALEQALAHAAVRIAEALKPAAEAPRADAPPTEAPAPEATAQAGADPVVWELTVRLRRDGLLQYLVTTADGQREWQVSYQPGLVEPLLRALQTQTRVDGQSAQTLAHLLIPADWASLPPAAAYRLTVSRETAAFPWEMLLEPTLWTRELSPPRVTRRLDGLRPTPHAALARSSSRALVIGDPDTSGMSVPTPFPFPLPGARQEAEAVADTLERAGFQVTRSIGEGASAVIGKLYGAPFRLALASGNAVRDHVLPNGNRVTGLALGNDVFLTVHELRQLRQLPEVVLLNGCHLGQVGTTAETAGADLVPDLLQAGVPVVVAPAGSVDDQAAAAFSSTFFAALAGNARLEDAVHEARVAALKAVPDAATWAAYQAWGDPDFRLFPSTAPAAE